MLFPSKSEIPELRKSQLMDSVNVSPDISAFQSALKHVSIRGEPLMKESSSVQIRENSSLKNNTRNRAVEEAKLLRLKKLAGLLFPSKALSMDASKANHSEVGIYYPGREWRDIAGHPIQAHGGGIIYVPKSETFFWYGENKGGRTYHLSKRGTARVDVLGVNCYSSKDLWSWKFEGRALKGEYRNKKSDLYVKNVVERPKVIYNDRSKLYVMWMHIDNGTYSKAAIGVAVSTHPVGPFEYLGSKRPHGCDSRDMTVFKDDNGDAYIVYSSQINNELHVGKLTEDYLDVMERGMEKIFIKQRREAPAVFKHKSIYYMLTSGCTSWNPNGALIHASTSMLGPWVTIGDPCVGGDEELRTLTFFSQGSFVLPLPGLQDTFIFMGDRWLPSDLRDSRYVWLPLTMNGPLYQGVSTDIHFPQLQRVSIRWADEWKLPQGWNNSQNL